MGAYQPYEAAPIGISAVSSCSHFANTIASGYGLEIAQASTRPGPIDYLPTLERLVQVPRLQWSCEVRANAHTTHGGIR